jgi:uncharacterized protein
MENRNTIGVMLIVLFTVMIFLFTRGIYSPFFVLLNGLFLTILFLKENKRVLTWILLAFFVGHLTVAYGDQFLENYHMSFLANALASQVLGLIPIFLIVYILHQFKRKLWHYRLIKTGPAYVWKWFLVITGLLLLLIVWMLILRKADINGSGVAFILLLSVIHACVNEVLWRGLLLPQFIHATGRKWGITVCSIAFGLGSTLFGITIPLSLLYIGLGFIFSFLTVKTNSLLPGIVAHTLITVIILLSGIVILPI